MFFQRRLALLAAAVVLAVSVMPATVHAAGAVSSPDNAQNNDDLTAVILRGLWEGVNLQIDNSSLSAAQPTNSQPVTAVTAGTYAALGDSVAAGVGLPAPLSVPAEQTRCGRTQGSYPVLVSRSLGMPLVDAACSGATAGDLVTKQRDGSPNLPPQLDTAFSSGVPSLITITAGANDVHWQQFLLACRYSNCANDTNSAAAASLRGALRIKLAAVLSSIQLRGGGPTPAVIYTGYYNPVSSACLGRISGVTADELSWFNTQLDKLNSAIQSVTRLYAFVRFVPVDFTGHDMCSAAPWVQGLSDPQPIHPNAIGQQVIARDILRSLGR